MKSWTLTAKLYTSGLTLLVLALTSIGLTLWVTWTLEGGAAAVNDEQHDVPANGTSA